MFGISGFFKNIQNAFTKEVVLRMKIKEIINKHTGADLPIENIQCKNGVVTVNKANSSVLSVIYIKKNKIITDLVDAGLKISDIR
jgi:hypothetical protein